MRRWLSSAVVTAFAVAAISSALVVAQTTTSTAAKPTAAAKQQATPAKAATPAKPATPGKAWTAPKTPWGDPDLQGVWNDATSTPLQRPAGKGETVNEGDANQFEEQLASDLNRDRRDGGPEVDVNRAYNEHWMDARRLKITNDHRTSLIVDPPDGRLPPTVPISPERQKIRAERQAAGRASMPGCRTSRRRCRCHPLHHPDRFAAVSADDLQQRLPDLSESRLCRHHPEMIHSARVIPLDGRPHIGSTLKQWLGDTRGHFEGTRSSSRRRTSAGRRHGVSGRESRDLQDHGAVHARRRRHRSITSSRFTIRRRGPSRGPAVVPWTKIDPKEQMYEYMCHEDNFDIVHLLTGARNARRTRR
jgi:hypothetical protein